MLPFPKLPVSLHSTKNSRILPAVTDSRRDQHLKKPVGSACSKASYTPPKYLTQPVKAGHMPFI